MLNVIDTIQSEVTFNKLRYQNMATFAKTSFNTAKYAAARPTYPRQLFDLIFRFHETGSVNGGSTQLANARWHQAVDLGCGTGMLLAQCNVHASYTIQPRRLSSSLLFKE